MPDFLLPRHLLKSGRSATHSVAVQNDETSLTFADFARDTARWQQTFATLAGQRISLYDEDAYQLACMLFGAWHAGKTPCLPADNLPATRAALRDIVDAFADELSPGATPAGAPSFSELCDNTARLVLFTSGSTGTPQAIDKKLGQLGEEVATLARQWEAVLQGDPVVVLGTVSHQHIYGLLFRVLWPLSAGRPFERLRSTFPETLLHRLRDTPAILVSSPAHLKRLPDTLDWASASTQIAAVFSSGGPLDKEALQRCKSLLGQAPHELYGSTETGGIATRCRQHDDEAPWQVLPGLELRVEGEQLSLRSPHLPDAHWHTTADRIRLEESGFVLLGRNDRIVKLEEKRISLDAIESALMACGAFSAVKAVVLPGAREVIGIAALPTPQGWSELARWGRREFAARHLEALKSSIIAEGLPRHWRYGARFPADAQGKVTVARLLAWFDPRRPVWHQASRSTTEAQIIIDVDAALPDFAGHFPGAPLLPGVTQLDWAIRLGRELFDLPEHFIGVDNLKFQSIISPDSQVTLSFTHDTDRHTLTFAYTSGTLQHASGRLCFGAVPC